MRRLHTLTLAVLLCLISVAPQAHVSATKHRLSTSAYAPGEVIVKLKKSSSVLSAADQAERLSRVKTLIPQNQQLVSDRGAEALLPVVADNNIGQIIANRGLDRVFVLSFDPGSDLDSILGVLRSRDDVEYAEPNYRIKPSSVFPNDPDFSSQWSLLNQGQVVGDFLATPNADIKASTAWDTTFGSSSVIVAVSDTGIDISHPDLERNIYTNPGEIAGNRIDDDKNGFVDDVHGFSVGDGKADVSDLAGHGTQMAGLIAAEINNNIGIAGVSQSRILPVRFFKKEGTDPEDYDATVADAARSLIYAIAAGASIINASWRTFLTPDEVPPEAALALKDAVSATNDAGVLLVCIAGNEGFNLDFSKIYPASYQMPNQIIVGASDYNDEIWHTPFFVFPIKSGFGPHTVDLAAPGVSVLTTMARGECTVCSKSANPADWYSRVDGTSVSAALVSGVAALVKSKYPNDNAILVKRRILAGVDVLPALGPYVITGGRLNADAALRAVITASHPELTSLKYKGGSEKLFLYGSGIEKGAVAVVGKAGYSAKLKGERFLARVPKSALPSGTPVSIKIRNPDGGESQPITLTR
ncbi:MAG TPA: S8 family serine peptidase [Blastocatellia bacterium]|nr:S8 family serine peptidase [Blastocatellia bacterium]